MGAILASVSLKKVSDIPNDSVVNNFAFRSMDEPPSPTTLDTIATELQQFYGVADPTTTRSVSSFLGESLQRGPTAGTIKFYDLAFHLDGTPHGSPIEILDFDLEGSGSATNLPDEVAICLSFHSAYGPDVEFGTLSRPRARDRGRVYLGPLNTDCLHLDSGTHEAFVTDEAATTIANCAGRLLAAMGTAGIPWCVWSRKNASVHDIQSGWVDNAFDSQRRRGNAPTRRSLFS